MLGDNYKFAVLVGAPLEEQTLYGLFETFDDADEWAQDNLGSSDPYSYIVRVFDPKDGNDE